jgi:sugar/nucleoside kinase (ribokinase family)
MSMRANPEKGFSRVVGIGGIGSGIVFALDGNQTLGRNESRLGRLLDARDYCKLHIVEHYIARLMGATARGTPFHVAAVGVVGDDEVGRQMLREMEEAGIDTRMVRADNTKRTLFSVCFVYPDSCGGNITTSNSAAAALSINDLRCAETLLRQKGTRGVALCLPEVPMEMRREFLRIATESGSYRAASFASAEVVEAHDTGMMLNLDLLAMNKEEAAVLVGHDYDTPNASALLADCAGKLTAQQPNIRIVVSAGSEGAYGFEAGSWDFCPAPKVTAVSTAGAGDALLSGVICGLASGLPFICAGPTSGSDGQMRGTRAGAERQLSSALDLGVLLAACTVQSPHTIHPEASVEALLAFASSLGVSFAGDLAAALCERQITSR